MTEIDVPKCGNCRQPWLCKCDSPTPPEKKYAVLKSKTKNPRYHKSGPVCPGRVRRKESYSYEIEEVSDEDIWLLGLLPCTYCYPPS